MTEPINRREFLSLAALGSGALAIRSWRRGEPSLAALPETRLGRVTTAGLPLKTRPHADSPTIRPLYEDEIVVVLRRLVGYQPYRFNQIWIETPDGYLWSPAVQPVRNSPNPPVRTLPETGLGPGMWAEVTVPTVDLVLDNPPVRAPWLNYRVSTLGLPPRFFYSQIVWVDRIREDETGQIWYRLNERFGSGDIFWAPAEAFHPLTPDEMSPLRPDVKEKHIEVNIAYQTMACFEGQEEVYFARVSTGALYNASGERVNAWETPIGEHRIWRKTVSLPLSGGSASAGWSLPAVGWISLFVGSGVAFHSTYWHNNYGEPTSRGCVNCSPEDAKWIFRWTMPSVPYDPGDVTVGMPGGTRVKVVEL